jgi:hypothetical protein
VHDDQGWRWWEVGSGSGQGGAPMSGGGIRDGPPLAEQQILQGCS